MYRSSPPGVVPSHSQYVLPTAPLVQLNVTVDDERVVPGTGDTICASVTAPGVLVTVGVSVLVGVAVGVPVAVAVGVNVFVGVFDGVSDSPTVGEAVGVRVGVAVATGATGVDVTTPGPYG